MSYDNVGGSKSLCNINVFFATAILMLWLIYLFIYLFIVVIIYFLTYFEHISPMRERNWENIQIM